jgi:hypothetical protein
VEAKIRPLEGRNGPTARLELPTEIAETGGVGFPLELADDIVTVGDTLAPPDDDPGGTTTPTEASAAAPSMIIDTAMANPTA